MDPPWDRAMVVLRSVQEYEWKCSACFEINVTDGNTRMNGNALMDDIVKED